ncbi:Structural maintenance of chromosomes protein 1, partial [Nowakowskiella sp. JEL0078]
MIESIEVYNFKTYSGKQSFGPFKKFNCIIGPNGSGKSNIMDAISFVFGISDFHLLRVDGLNLLVNSGAVSSEISEDPVIAYVEATFKSDSVTTKLKREILLRNNKNVFRINNKVSDKKSYGDVEAVASQSAKQLSKLFDQISGSIQLSKQYDAAKQLLEKLTETSTHNFSKKRGITSELKTFREQKDEADRFNQRIKAKDKLIVEYQMWKLWHLTSSIEELTRELENERLQLRETPANNLKEENLKTLKKELIKIGRELSKIEKKMKDKEKEMDLLTPQILKTTQTKGHNLKKLETASKNLDIAKNQVETQLATINDLKRQLEQVTNAKNVFEAESNRQKTARKGVVLSNKDLAEYQGLKERVAQATTAQSQKLPNLKRLLKAANEKVSRSSEVRTV